MISDNSLKTAMANYSKQLDSIARSDMKPVQKGQAREKVVIEAITHLMDGVGPGVDKIHSFDGNGEIMLTKTGKSPYSNPFGEKLSGILSQYETRTGTSPILSQVLPSNGWARIHHFTAEKIIRDLGKGHTLTLETGAKSAHDDAPSL